MRISIERCTGCSEHQSVLLHLLTPAGALPAPGWLLAQMMHVHLFQEMRRVLRVTMHAVARRLTPAGVLPAPAACIHNACTSPSRDTLGAKSTVACCCIAPGTCPCFASTWLAACICNACASHSRDGETQRVLREIHRARRARKHAVS